ncbi:16S rRNA (adenine(1518)-N(6)/adenine(1519)-N(6))-dimethyltransferase RsmA [Psittacicella gerlachiana]|uniref:Ribosomal RNA small subunit methyltransferase A n=1 Tax=Psittacicella gerlachiana TaxID=2028574 RepID=A0A3A1YNG2_9GAMM|nr:16S rRNA (adenine(1518)-N(6)/adenine(1519)-N(6))-dimethyltransferase RsmA [Psittacicella gerlachiana]RIY38510.1 16S rRNA (adenine(1518)-N(6)/adenine(1519)-N(6))-dimethyltransferase [Psittacicella gerlachiana]
MQNKSHLGHVAKKRFGQNFLIDQDIIHAIVLAINPTNNDNLIEIGPGLGALTEPVTDKVDHLTVIEVDKDLIERLKNHPFLSKKLEVIESDVLSIDFSTLTKPEQKMKVFGNLPYNISSPLILHLLNHTDIVSEMTFMLQKEVVERLAAVKGNKHYGRLSLITQYFCNVIPVIDVPPNSFKPAPKVDSAVVKLIPHQVIKNPVKRVKDFETVTGLAFGQRRKTIRNSLGKLILDQDWQGLAQFNITPNMRAEELSLDQYINLTNFAIENNLFERLK